MDDQLSFAAVSHDWNPMHVDPVAARRLLSGRPVVHGIHTLLHALNRWEADGDDRPSELRCTFNNPINVGDDVVFSQQATDGHRSTLMATVEGLPCMTAILGQATASRAVAPDGTQGVHGVASHDIVATPLDREPEAVVGEHMSIAGDDRPLFAMFPRATSQFGEAVVSALARASYLVGMVCPGMHSVFSSIRLEWDAVQSRDELVYHVRKFDPRFGLFVIALEGAVRGEIRAFLRPRPQVQPTAGDVQQHVMSGEFREVRALVIGGSRGLGELSAKLLAAGGADVTVTYASGKADAVRVADEINDNGRGRCRAAQLDLREGTYEGMDVDAAALTDVFFFATPRIFRRTADQFNRQRFDEFVEFYLEGMQKLCLWLNGVSRPSPVRVYLPSTVFITERPKGMTEYAMAKAAAEILADDLNSSLKHVRIIHSRLPRMATDQTAGLARAETDSAVDVLLPVLREVTLGTSQVAG